MLSTNSFCQSDSVMTWFETKLPSVYLLKKCFQMVHTDYNTVMTLLMMLGSTLIFNIFYFCDHTVNLGMLYPKAFSNIYCHHLVKIWFVCFFFFSWWNQYIYAIILRNTYSLALMFYILYEALSSKYFIEYN